MRPRCASHALATRISRIPEPQPGSRKSSSILGRRQRWVLDTFMLPRPDALAHAVSAKRFCSVHARNGWLPTQPASAPRNRSTGGQGSRVRSISIGRKLRRPANFQSTFVDLFVDGARPADLPRRLPLAPQASCRSMASSSGKRSRVKRLGGRMPLR
jgi:hypothetical protein